MRFMRNKRPRSKRISKLEQTAKEIATVYGGKPEDYIDSLNDSDPKVQELMAELEGLDNIGHEGHLPCGSSWRLQESGPNNMR
jgi:hypothetical protein